jgi:hypothetical protein
MSPIIILGAGALVLLFASKRKNVSDTSSVVTAPDGSLQYRIETKETGGNTYVMVTALMSKFGAKDTTLITYAVPTGKEGPRTLVTFTKDAPRGLIDKAIADFDVKVPAGVSLPTK